MGGGKTTVTEKASDLDRAFAETARSVSPLLLDYVKKGMMGVPTPGQTYGSQMAMNELKRQSGKMSVAPGSPEMMDSFRKISESLTKPDANILNMAMALYTGASPLLGQGGQTVQKTSPGPMDVISSILPFAMFAL